MMIGSVIIDFNVPEVYVNQLNQTLQSATLVSGYSVLGVTATYPSSSTSTSGAEQSPSSSEGGLKQVRNFLEK